MQQLFIDPYEWKDAAIAANYYVNHLEVTWEAISRKKPFTIVGIWNKETQEGYLDIPETK